MLCSNCTFAYIFSVIHTQASSTDRKKNLLSLRDYMQRCTNELYWLDQQADERIMYDWSDANLDYPARKRQYEVTTLTKWCLMVLELNEHISESYITTSAVFSTGSVLQD